MNNFLNSIIFQYLSMCGYLIVVFHLTQTQGKKIRIKIYKREKRLKIKIRSKSGEPILLEIKLFGLTFS